MMICQKCGVKGKLKHLIYCNRCRVSAEHSYCMDIVLKHHNKEAIWTCKDCRRGNSSQVESRKSDRIREAIAIKLDRIKKIRKRINFHRNRSSVIERMTETKQSINDLFRLSHDMKIQYSSQSLENEEKRKRKRKLILDDGDKSDRECGSMEGFVLDPYQQVPAILTPSQTMSYSSPSSKSEEYICAQPIVNPIWKGCFNIQNEKKQTFIRILAHLSTKACSKAYNAASVLPKHLHIDILSKVDMWPQMFQTTPPNDEHIALYFFPEFESDERAFENLIEDMIYHDYALKAVINNLELLIFSSRELPFEYWRFRRRYYIWGVFKPTRTW